MTTTHWLRAERASLAADQILDAAGALFAVHGVGAVAMADVAVAAGCSRATLYRYFDSRDALRSAFVHREARRLGAVVAERVGAVDDPHERLAQPEADVDHERALLEQFVAPVVAGGR